ncbi:MAG: TetR/AcrR family transcriptional regulator [Acidobacteriota bacterium]
MPASEQLSTVQVSAKGTQRRSLETRRKIVVAALEDFSRRGFEGASTRSIAALAGVALARVTYHFESKEALWKAVAGHVFELLEKRLTSRAEGLAGVDDGTKMRLLLREWITFTADHPQLHRFMQQETMSRTERLEWLVDKHVRPRFLELQEQFLDGEDGLRLRAPLRTAHPGHLYYLLIGAAATPYAAADEFELLTGVAPDAGGLVEQHVDLVLALFFEDASTKEEG